MATEIIVGAVGALASLAAGLFKTLYYSHQENPESVTVTVRRGADTIEKKGTMRPDDVSKMLDMVRKDRDPVVPVK